MVSLQFKDLIQNPPVLEKYIPNFEYWLCDLSTYSDAEIKGNIILRVMLGLLKYIMHLEFSDKVGQILGLLDALHKRDTGLEYLETALR